MARRPPGRSCGNHDRIVAHAAIVEGNTRRRGKVRVAGVLNVFVLPDCRGQGLFRQVMSTAMDEAYRRRSDFGLLFCTPEIGTKYERLGWRLLADRRVTRIDEQGQRAAAPRQKRDVVLSPAAIRRSRRRHPSVGK